MKNKCLEFVFDFNAEEKEEVVRFPLPSRLGEGAAVYMEQLAD
jgi:hypothetical protein